ncbi:sel1 repeat family protein [Collinsella sp. AGMB00827]|uniref:Sel1 repeat family protein n=1 Tax=Collinsella ureilytica TaxID=2869515 RepID=A0ABS7MIG1_9ACTN|nr:tetratricopeptide repeat protein [Collinsella urealyticum]MBY4797161.1 sel1 repeat family protein [Collinsella urealyticum]
MPQVEKYVLSQEDTEQFDAIIQRRRDADNEQADEHTAQHGDQSTLHFASISYEDARVADAQKEADQLIDMLIAAIQSFDPDEFADLVQSNQEKILQLSFVDPAIATLVVIGYRKGIQAGSGLCMHNLGAAYYMGSIVEQDYHKAAELYELACRHGFYLAYVNLGYIYEYGRLGTPEYKLAYQCYSLGALLAESAEAYYKLGDLFARGRFVQADPIVARELWEKSLELADDPAIYAQPALRIAKSLIDEYALDAGLTGDPMRALTLFQKAEIGLRIDIANGMEYYRGRLQEAIEGQEKARELLEVETLR